MKWREMLSKVIFCLSKWLQAAILNQKFKLKQLRTLSTQRLASFLIHLCLSCFFGYNLLPNANFLKLTKTYQFM